MDASFPQRLLSDSSAAPVLTRCVPFGKSHNLSGPQLCISPVCWGLTVCWAQGQVRLRAISCSPLCLCKEDMEAQRGWEPCPRTPSLGAWSGAGPELAPAPLSLTAPSPPPLPGPLLPSRPTPHLTFLPLRWSRIRSLLQMISMCRGLGFPSSGPVPLGTEAPHGLMLPGRGLPSSSEAPPDPGWGPGGTRSGHLV